MEKFGPYAEEKMIQFYLNRPDVRHELGVDMEEDGGVKKFIGCSDEVGSLLPIMFLRRANETADRLVSASRPLVTSPRPATSTPPTWSTTESRLFLTLVSRVSVHTARKHH